VIDKDKEKQWDREMAEVDRLLKRLPTYEGTRPRSGSDPALRRPSGETPMGHASRLGTWMRLGLAVALAGGMAVWPYSRVCGLNLFVYLGGVVTLFLAGAWSAVAAWHHRHGFAHALALVITLWGLVLAAGVVLPRVGYAKAPGIWLCPETTAPPSR
jgi:hypothetical protein